MRQRILVKDNSNVETTGPGQGQHRRWDLSRSVGIIGDHIDMVHNKMGDSVEMPKIKEVFALAHHSFLNTRTLYWCTQSPDSLYVLRSPQHRIIAFATRSNDAQPC